MKAVPDDIRKQTLDKAVLEGDLRNSVDARLVMILLLEVVDALKARGLVKNEDVAGALLRAEYCAKASDKAYENAGTATDLLATKMKECAEEWQKRFDLGPDLYRLRVADSYWRAAGGHGRHPFHPEAIVELFSQNNDLESA